MCKLVGKYTQSHGSYGSVSFFRNIFLGNDELRDWFAGHSDGMLKRKGVCVRVYNTSNRKYLLYMFIHDINCKH